MTIILALSQIEAAQTERPPGYTAEVLARGTVDKEAGTVELAREVYDELRLKYSGRAAGCCGEG